MNYRRIYRHCDYYTYIYIYNIQFLCIKKITVIFWYTIWKILHQRVGFNINLCSLGSLCFMMLQHKFMLTMFYVLCYTTNFSFIPRICEFLPRGSLLSPNNGIFFFFYFRGFRGFHGFRGLTARRSCRDHVGVTKMSFRATNNF